LHRREKGKLNKVAKNIGIYVIIFALVLAMAWIYQNGTKETVKEIDFSQAAKHLPAQEISEMNVTDKTLTATLKSGEKIISYIPTGIDFSYISEKYIMPQVETGTLKYNSDKPVVQPWYIAMLPTLIMILALVFFWFIIVNQGAGGGRVMSFGRSRARLHKEDDLKKVTFADVAGLDEEKEELTEIVDFLQNPKKYNDLGARIPKGILLVGQIGRASCRERVFQPV
jgi:cell division protease FtsH